MACGLTKAEVIACVAYVPLIDGLCTQLYMNNGQYVKCGCPLSSHCDMRVVPSVGKSTVSGNVKLMQKLTYLIYFCS